MSGSRGTTQDGRKRGFSHVNGSIASVHFIWRWPKQQIYPSLSTNLFILGLRSRVFVEIRTRLELEWIDENADRNFAAPAGLFSCDPDQFPMSLMQRPHGRDQNRTRVAATHVLMSGVTCFDYFHWDRARLLVDRRRTVCAQNSSNRRALLTDAFRRS